MLEAFKEAQPASCGHRCKQLNQLVYENFLLWGWLDNEHFFILFFFKGHINGTYKEIFNKLF